MGGLPVLHPWEAYMGGLPCFTPLGGIYGRFSPCFTLLGGIIGRFTPCFTPWEARMRVNVSYSPRETRMKVNVSNVPIRPRSGGGEKE